MDDSREVLHNGRLRFVSTMDPSEAKLSIETHDIQVFTKKSNRLSTECLLQKLETGTG